jgi:ABC-type sugar transport system permease subunit
MQPRRLNVRAWLAFIFGLVAVVTIPAAIELTRKIPGAVLLDAVWAIPVAALAATASLLFARGARGAIARTLERAGGSTWIRLGRILAVAGICLTLSASISVGLYELLLRLEH